MSVVVTSKKKKGGGKGKWLPFVLVLGVVVGGGLWFWLGGDASSVTNNNDAGMRRPPVNEVQQNPAQDASPPKVHTPQVVEQDNSEPVSAAKPPKPKTDPKFPQYFDENGNFIKAPGRMMLPDGQVITFKAPEEGKTRTIVSNGRLYECDHEGNFKDATPRKIFDNSFEEGLVGLSVDGGTFIPGMLKGLDTNAVLEMLRRPVIMNGDESDDERAKKEAVAEMKGVILDYIAQGGTFDDFVSEMQAYTTAERKLKGEALRNLSKLVREGKKEEALKYLDAMDGAMQDQGFSKIRLPKHLSEVLGVEQ